MPERIVRPGILTSDAVNTLSWGAEVFYRRLMSVVDDYGRFDGRNSILRANLYPLLLSKVSESDVGKWKAETVEAGLVRPYSVESKEYLLIEKFDQRLRALRSKFPAPPDICGHPHADDGELRASADIRNGVGVGGACGDGGEKPPTPKGGRVEPVPLSQVPQNLLTPEFLDAWDRWQKYRSEARKKLTPSTAEGQLAKLAKAGPTVAVAMIDQSISQGWQGLFDVKGLGPSPSQARINPLTGKPI